MDSEQKKSLPHEMWDTAVDGLADRGSVLGRALQVWNDTDGYRDRKLQREINRQKLLEYRDAEPERKAQKEHDAKQRGYESARIDEWNKGADVRAQTLKNQELDASMYPAEREAQNKLSMAKSDLAMDLLHADHMKQALPGVKKRYQEMFSSSPEFESLSDSERKQMMDSPKMEGYYELAYWQDQLKAYSSGDTVAGDRLNRGIKRMGASINQGDDGIPYVEWGDGRRLSATPENVSKIMSSAASEIKEELSARKAISYNSTRNNPVGRFIGSNAAEIMKFNGGSASKALNMIREVTQDAKPEEQEWMMVNQAFKDYRSSDLTQADKLACLQTLIMPRPSLVKGSVDLQGNPMSRPSVLQSLGYEVEGVPDPANIEKTLFTKHGKTGLFTFADVMKDAEDNDSLSKSLEYRIGMAQMQSVMKSKAPAGNTKTAKEAKAKLASDWLGEEGEAVNDLPPVSQAETNELARVFGSDEIIRTPPEQRRNIINAQKEAMAVAMSEGLVVQSEDGSLQLKEGITPDEIDHLASLEQGAFERAGLDEFSKKGQLNRFKELFNAQKDQVRAEESIKKSQDAKKNIEGAKKLLTPAGQALTGGLDTSNMLYSILEGLGKRKKAKAQESEKKAKSRLGLEK